MNKVSNYTKKTLRIHLNLVLKNQVLALITISFPILLRWALVKTLTISFCSIPSAEQSFPFKPHKTSYPPSLKSCMITCVRSLVRPKRKSPPRVISFQCTIDMNTRLWRELLIPKVYFTRDFPRSCFRRIDIKLVTMIQISTWKSTN